MRRSLRRLAEQLLLAIRADRRGHARMRGRRLVLAYHNVVSRSASGTGETTLHLPQDRFTDQLDLLSRVAEVVPLDRLDESVEAQKPRVAITWDDAYRGAVTLGVAETIRRGFPATIFVAPGRLGGQTFWWDRLAHQLGGVIPPALREQALTICRGRESEIASRLGSGVPDAALPAELHTASEQEIAEAQRRPGITLGSHTWSHANLAALDDPDLGEELVRSREWLGKYLGRVLSISYPYGCSSPTVRSAAAREGYRTGWRVSGGWIPPAPTDQLNLPRLSVPAGLSLEGFSLRLAGWFCR